MLGACRRCAPSRLSPVTTVATAAPISTYSARIVLTSDLHRIAPQSEIRDRPGKWQNVDTFFQSTHAGQYCRTNWYEGNWGALGWENHIQHFKKDAPALLGFDEDIDWFCQRHDGCSHAECCVQTNNNILSLYGDRMPYNICRNLEWQVCAAKGMLPGQRTPTIRFARAPRTLAPDGSTGKPLGKCHGWVPPDRPTGGLYGYATDDIFYLEVCLYNQICSNGDELFRLDPGDAFVCAYSADRFLELEQILLQPPAPMPGVEGCLHGTAG